MPGDFGTGLVFFLSTYSKLVYWLCCSIYNKTPLPCIMIYDFKPTLPVLLCCSSLQMDTEASDLLNDLQVKLNNVLDELSRTFGNRYSIITHTHTTACINNITRLLLIICLFSFQSRINDCMRQMASLLYQIKGPLNANNKNQVEGDSDNMLRPLMDFLDGKWVDSLQF